MPTLPHCDPLLQRSVSNKFFVLKDDTKYPFTTFQSIYFRILALKLAACSTVVFSVCIRVGNGKLCDNIWF